MVNKSNIKKQILEIFKKDQEIRKKGTYDITIDKENTKRLKKVINKIDWPKSEIFGKKIENFSWVIVQHSDFDIPFQKKCLKLIQKLPNLKHRKQNIAYLTDRILVNKRRKQIYGTQFYVNRKLKALPRPIRDVKNLNRRRKEAGLKPINKYYKDILKEVKRIK